MKTSFLNTLIVITGMAFLTANCDTLLPGKKKASGDISDPTSFASNMHYTHYILEMNDSIARRYKALGITSASISANKITDVILSKTSK